MFNRINRIRANLLECDWDCENCKDTNACIADMKQAVYEILGMLEELAQGMNIYSECSASRNMEGEHYI